MAICYRGAVLFIVLSAIACSGCQSLPTFRVAGCRDAFRIDGRLDEGCYAKTKPLRGFVVAGQPGKIPPLTKAWAFWQPEQFVFAFECRDSNIIARAATDNENDVDGQDRVELFLWSGKPGDPYYCIEIAARGAVHDYRARFYRQFDSSWSVPDWKYAVTPTKEGYCVEAALSRDAMRRCGFDLKRGARFRGGLFRADFWSAEPGIEPDWITWVDARTPQPDFHVAGAFGTLGLVR